MAAYSMWRKHLLDRTQIRGKYLICFVGIDGSGKTTHAKSLASFLTQKGFPCVYIWGAFRPIISYPFFLLTRMLGYWKETKENAYTDPLEFAPDQSRQRLRRIWQFFIFIDSQIKVLAIRFLLAFGRVVICDRYVYDILMELQLSGLHDQGFERLLCKTVPKPNVTFLMNVPEKIAIARRSLPAENLSAKKQTLIDMAKTYHFVEVNAARDFSQNQERIRTAIMALQEDAFNEVGKTH